MNSHPQLVQPSNCEVMTPMKLATNLTDEKVKKKTRVTLKPVRNVTGYTTHSILYYIIILRD